MDQKTATQATPQGQAVVEQVKMPKLKVSGKGITIINTVAMCFAIYFGIACIMAAIASFTDGNWSFNIPTMSYWLDGANSGPVDTLLNTAILAAVSGVVAIFTIGKITDATLLKRSWGVASKVFMVVAALLCVELVSTAIYSLLSLGVKSPKNLQATLWGSCFVPTLIMAAVAACIAFIAKKVADGKTAMLRGVSFGAVACGAIAVIIVIVSILVGFYAEKKRSTYDKYEDLYSDWLDF